MNTPELEHKTRDELIELAKERGISSYTGLKKQDTLSSESHFRIYMNWEAKYFAGKWRQ